MSFGHTKRDRAPIFFVPGAWSFGCSQFFHWCKVAREYGFLAESICLWGHNGNHSLHQVSISKYVEELGRKICTDGPVHLVGHSMGGLIVQILAFRYPDLVSSATLVCTSPPSGIRLPFIPRLLWPRYIWGVGTGRAYRLAKSEQRFLCSEKGGGSSIPDFGPESGLATREMLTGKWDVPSLPCPALVIAGSEDKVCPPKVQHAVAVKYADEGAVIIDGAGHMIHLGKKSTEVIYSILTWIIEFNEEKAEQMTVIS